jgi:hypothetical protein
MDKALASLKKLKTVYQNTAEVNVGEELLVKIRLLTSEEETEVHAYCVNNFEQGISYLYAVKRETLCRCITFMNGTHIPEMVEDEENGKEKVMRYIWLRENIVSGWTQMVVDEIWRGYANLMANTEMKIKGSVQKEDLIEEKNE